MHSPIVCATYFSVLAGIRKGEAQQALYPASVVSVDFGVKLWPEIVAGSCFLFWLLHCHLCSGVVLLFSQQLAA